MTIPFRFQRAVVLVVDDDQACRLLMTTALANAGFKNIETAGDGIEALEKSISLRPDVVLLDLLMPRLDGIGYCRRIRSEPHAPHMPIIVQTAAEDRETKLGALSCGADDFLYKPVDPVELILRTRIHLQRYFIQQDMGEMCSYLRTELDQALALLRNMEKTAVAPAMYDLMNRHCEVLETMAVIPMAKV